MSVRKKGHGRTHIIYLPRRTGSICRHAVSITAGCYDNIVAPPPPPSPPLPQLFLYCWQNIMFQNWEMILRTPNACDMKAFTFVSHLEG